MRRSTTFAGTERPFLAVVLLVELVVAVALLAWPKAVPSESHPRDETSASVAASSPPAKPERVTLRDGRTAEVTTLGAVRTAELARRIVGELDDAADAVTAFWGDDWRRDIVILVAGTDEEFTVFGGGGSDIAAATTPERIVFAPGAAAMSQSALRVVLRHELFHYAARRDTAADAPRWLTEGVADFVGRSYTPRPGRAAAAVLAQLPTDADLDTAGPTRSLAYDRAWWFSRFVADRYGTDGLRRLYLAACGKGHTDVRTAIRATLGFDEIDVLAAWRRWLAN